MIYSHLKGHRNIKSCFSSWTAQFDVAFEYSEYLDTGRIAIIDTNFLEPHVKIYHVLALQDANLTTSDYYEEYLVYGPIQGRAYRCVKRTELERTGTSFLDPSGYPLSALPAENFTPQFASQIRKVGLLFRHPEDKGPDVILTFAAIMIGCMFEVESPTDVAIATRFILYYFTPEIKALKLPAGTPVFGNLGLVNPMVYTLQQPELKYAVKVLEAIEIYVRHYES
ncbi:hypothetical protein F5Y04DRAFT_280766 [Hypomontagnella monticulosa]|nr:hypothetical protein F5Y04DRAFT_280766 [Hypomontagnella monticulosa]